MRCVVRVYASDRRYSHIAATRRNDDICQALEQLTERFLTVPHRERDDVIQQVGRYRVVAWRRTDRQHARFEDKHTDHTQDGANKWTRHMPWPIVGIPIMLMLKNARQRDEHGSHSAEPWYPYRHHRVKVLERE